MWNNYSFKTSGEPLESIRNDTNIDSSMLQSVVTESVLVAPSPPAKGKKVQLKLPFSVELYLDSLSSKPQPGDASITRLEPSSRTLAGLTHEEILNIFSKEHFPYTSIASY